MPAWSIHRIFSVNFQCRTMHSKLNRCYKFPVLSKTLLHLDCSCKTGRYVSQNFFPPIFFFVLLSCDCSLFWFLLGFQRISIILILDAIQNSFVVRGAIEKSFMFIAQSRDSHKLQNSRNCNRNTICIERWWNVNWVSLMKHWCIHYNRIFGICLRLRPQLSCEYQK